MNDQSIEQEIQAKGLTAPRVTPEQLDANIHHIETVKHVTQSGQVLRWSVLVTQNGFAVVGRPSVSASPENDDAEIGEKVAFENSRQELWPLMGYALKERLSATPIVASEPTGDIKVGTLVRLNSGGPKMVAGATLANGNVECQWRTEHGNPTYEVGQFPAECLTILGQDAA